MRNYGVGFADGLELFKPFPVIVSEVAATLMLLNVYWFLIKWSIRQFIAPKVRQERYETGFCNFLFHKTRPFYEKCVLLGKIFRFGKFLIPNS